MFSQRSQLLEKLICVIVLCVVLTSSLSYAQVTFSRDWNAGKRSLAEAVQPTSECAVIWRSMTNLCAAVTKNIQHLTLCEARALIKNIQNDDSSMENNSGNNLPMFANGHL
ncbi:adipokinetic hormone/corazonin-related peptide-like [Ochlerotatus camptorhynchus]|uniref:adipokinetic hormone/corazonin-related peptide-like n=1 Tax=Ochlerotatus camptorhynchus TaxID=644619 RepID=UPI0031D4DF74